jgi:antitoxin (DNA-binding transcriptional repressor) of toxin-antitoxin stability system
VDEMIWLKLVVAMLIIDIEEAKKRLSKLVDMAAKGESFIIAQDGKHLVTVSALDANGAFEDVQSKTE